MTHHYYALLGVDDKADEAALRTAYKKLAIRFHPDKNPEGKQREEAEKKFKIINEAFSVLSDKRQRFIYDQLGDEGFKRQQQANAHNTYTAAAASSRPASTPSPAPKKQPSAPSQTPPTQSPLSAAARRTTATPTAPPKPSRSPPTATPRPTTSPSPSASPSPAPQKASPAMTAPSPPAQPLHKTNAPPPSQAKPQQASRPASASPLQTGAAASRTPPLGIFGLFSTQPPTPPAPPAMPPTQPTARSSSQTSSSPLQSGTSVSRPQAAPPVMTRVPQTPAPPPNQPPAPHQSSPTSYDSHWQPRTAEEEDRALAMALEASINGPEPHGASRARSISRAQEEEDKALAMALEASINNPPEASTSRSQEEDDRDLAIALEASINIQPQANTSQYPHHTPPPPSSYYPYMPPPSPPPPAPTPATFTTPAPLSTSNDPSACPGCGKQVGFFEGSVKVQASKWHQSCLRCQGPGCGQSLVGAMFAIGEDGRPYHPSCHKILFHPKCCICDDFIPELSTGRIQFKETRYWRQKFCPCHESSGIKCCSCSRYQQRDSSSPFVDLNDPGSTRSLCLECVSSVVLDAKDAQPLYREVLSFYRSMGMEFPETPPLMLVDSRTLDEYGNREGRTLSGGPIFHVRGLMLATVYHSIPSIVRGAGSFLGSPFGVSSVMSPTATAKVTAILVLYGLPRLLTGSILAHELFHAWLKARGVISLDSQSEEGVCQLMAYLWIDSQHRKLAEEKDEMQIKLASYFSFEIREDQSEVYGKGFRIAYDAFQLHGGGLRGLAGVIDSLLRTGRADS